MCLVQGHPKPVVRVRLIRADVGKAGWRILIRKGWSALGSYVQGELGVEASSSPTPTPNCSPLVEEASPAYHPRLGAAGAWGAPEDLTGGRPDCRGQRACLTEEDESLCERRMRHCV